MPLQITGVLPKKFDGAVRKALHEALHNRPEEFVVEIGWPHTEMVVHIHAPFDKRLKFNGTNEADIARELLSVVTEIVEADLGPAKKS